MLRYNSAVTESGIGNDGRHRPKDVVWCDIVINHAERKAPQAHTQVGLGMDKPNQF